MDLPCLNSDAGERWQAINGDCVDVLSGFPGGCVDFSVYSPPFGSLFVYSESAADMGNSTDNEFAEHYSWLVREKFRVTKPGRLTAVHCSDLPMTKWKDGAVGIKDFSGQIIRIHEDAGWIMHSRRTIWKCPVVEMTRTKHVGLLYKQLQKDSAKSRGGMPDYLLTFVKPGENPDPIAHTPSEFPLSQWQEWASPIWNSVDQSNVLNVEAARTSGDERHLCPLQLDVIERALIMWSNAGDVVLSPFMGIGSEGVMSLRRGAPARRRRAKGKLLAAGVPILASGRRTGRFIQKAIGMIFFPILAAGMASSVCASVAVCWPLALLNGEPKQKPDKPRHARQKPKRGRPRLRVMKGGRE